MLENSTSTSSINESMRQNAFGSWCSGNKRMDAAQVCGRLLDLKGRKNSEGKGIYSKRTRECHFADVICRQYTNRCMRSASDWLKYPWRLYLEYLHPLENLEITIGMYHFGNILWQIFDCRPWVNPVNLQIQTGSIPYNMLGFTRVEHLPPFNLNE